MQADLAEAPCGETSDPGFSGPYDTDSCRCDGNNNYGGTSASLSIIIPVVIAAVILLVAILYLVRKRRVAARQLHRQSSMPTIGGDDEAEVEA